MAGSERPTEHQDEPLFQGQEEQERVYAPEEVPGTDIPPVERDAGATSADNTAVATDPDRDTTTGDTIFMRR